MSRELALLALQPATARQNSSYMPILSRADLQFFEDNGYVVARGAISREQAARTAAEVWEFSGKDPTQPDTWRDPEKPGIMIEMYHGPNQWANRTAPGVHEAFAQIVRPASLPNRPPLPPHVPFPHRAPTPPPRTSPLGRRSGGRRGCGAATTA